MKLIYYLNLYLIITMKDRIQTHIFHHLNNNNNTFYIVPLSIAMIRALRMLIKAYEYYLKKIYIFIYNNMYNVNH